MDMKTFRIAIPLSGGSFAAHFGGCDEFVLIDVEKEFNQILGSSSYPAPEHTPGAFPMWLAKMNVNLIICGGVGHKAKLLFKKNNIDLMMCDTYLEPQEIVKKYLEGTLQTVDRSCDDHGPKLHNCH